MIIKRAIDWCCAGFMRWLLKWVGDTYGESEEDAEVTVQAQRERIEERKRERIKIDATINAQLEMEAPESFSDLFDFGADEEEDEQDTRDK